MKNNIRLLKLLYEISANFLILFIILSSFVSFVLFLELYNMNIFNVYLVSIIMFLGFLSYGIVVIISGAGYADEFLYYEMLKIDKRYKKYKK